MKAVLAAFAAGVLFALGLAIAGMTDPSKIIAFLDVGGAWDPALAFVMAGALAVYAPLNRIVRRRPAPLLAKAFSPLTKQRIDAPLVAGAAMFGAGWGLSGYCPGPALAGLVQGGPPLLLFVASMIGGFAVHDLLARRRHAPTNDGTPALQYERGTDGH